MHRAVVRERTAHCRRLVTLVKYINTSYRRALLGQLLKIYSSSCELSAKSALHKLPKRTIQWSFLQALTGPCSCQRLLSSVASSAAHYDLRCQLTHEKKLALGPLFALNPPNCPSAVSERLMHFLFQIFSSKLNHGL